MVSRLRENSGRVARYRKQRMQIFLPPAIGGKILETWELRRFQVGRSSVLELRMYARLSKIADYLIDNLCVLMLSQLKRRGQGESGRFAEPVPNWEILDLSPYIIRSEPETAVVMQAPAPCERPQGTGIRQGAAHPQLNSFGQGLGARQFGALENPPVRISFQAEDGTTASAVAGAGIPTQFCCPVEASLSSLNESPNGV